MGCYSGFAELNQPFRAPGPNPFEGPIPEADISDFNETELAMCWLTDGKKTVRLVLWKHTKEKCLAAGMTLHQDSNAEGILTLILTSPDRRSWRSNV